MNIVFPYLEKYKEEKCISKEQYTLVIMDTFKGQDNEILKELCDKNFCEVVIFPHNLTNKFQPLDISFNKPAKAFISNEYNRWFSKQVSAQFALRTEHSNVKVSAKLSDIKPLHTQWIVNLCNHMRGEKDKIINGFKSTGVTEAIQSAQEIVTEVENPFRVSSMLYRFHLYYVHARTICALLSILSNVQTHLYYGLIHVKSIFCILS